MKVLVQSGVVAAVFGGLALFGMGFAPAGPGVRPSNRAEACFYVNQFENWRAPNAKTIYIRTDFRRYYRLDLAGRYPSLRWPDAYLIMNVHGPDTICSAVDWDLRVDETPDGIPTGVIVKKMMVLSPAEVAAIPKKFRP